MTITIPKKIITPALTLVIGFLLGLSGTFPSNAEDLTPVAQGEILKVCINLKTGVIRVSNKCDSKTERKTVLGGVGAQGVKGETGAVGPQGIQGPQGPQGLTGAAGSLSGLNKTTLNFLNGENRSLPRGCPFQDRMTSTTVLTGISLSTSFGITNLNPSSTTLIGCSVTVYTP